MTPTELKKKIENVVKQRLAVIKSKRSGKNIARCIEICKATQAWLSAYPSASDIQLLRFFVRHGQDILYITPSCDKKVIEEFKQLLIEVRGKV